MEVGAVGHNLKEDGHIRTIPAKLGLIWFSSFRENLNVIFHQNIPNLHNWYKSITHCHVAAVKI